MKRFAPIWLLLLAVVCFGQAGRLNQSLLQLRRADHLTWEDPLENSPPLVSFTTVALGGFRGIIADMLWLRAARLQEEKKYFELVQLADWITKLEPRLALVWAFHAWNMAYNISVLLDAPQDRWRWVEHGIELLRDDGLKYNPGDPRLYRELGWLFQHKMGGTLDQAHRYYKQAWAKEMMALFDGARPDYAAAAAHPSEPRIERLRRVYKLEPALMQQVDAAIAPLDWRLPQAHAIYWAWRGQKYARGFAAVELDRMIFQSMQDAFWEGRLVYDPEEEVFLLAPNLEVLPRVRAAYERAIAAHPPEAAAMRNAHRNFLHAAILVLYQNHRLAEAGEVLADLQRRYPEAAGAGGLEQFVSRAFAEQIQELSLRDAAALVEGLLYQSYFWLALGDEGRSTGTVELARLCWQRYMKDKTDPEVRERIGLPPLRQLRRQAFARALATAKSAAARARLEASRPALESAAP